MVIHFIKYPLRVRPVILLNNLAVQPYCCSYISSACICSHSVYNTVGRSKRYGSRVLCLPADCCWSAPRRLYRMNIYVVVTCRKLLSVPCHVYIVIFSGFIHIIPTVIALLAVTVCKRLCLFVRARQLLRSIYSDCRYKLKHHSHYRHSA